MDSKFCKDCKHYDPGIVFPVCKRDEASRKTNPVDGEPVPRYCNVERAYRTAEACATEGRFFEAKEVAAPAPV